MTGLRLLRAGPACSVQDAGRHGFLRFGITPAGPMDWISHARVNALIGNPQGCAAIEIGPAGLCLEAQAALRIAVAALGFRVLRAGNVIPSHSVLTLTPGLRLELLPGPEGMWAYLGLPGGVDGAAVMGSLATHQRAGLGLFAGRCLQAGDTLEARYAGATADADFCLPLQTLRKDEPIRYIPGPQDDLFPAATHLALQTATFTVSSRSDRMAYRLTGPPLPATSGHDIVSDGIALGAIQVPGDGQPFVLMADRQPTGGYPKIGTVIRADLPRLAQMRPGQPFRFQPVSVENAVAALATARESTGFARRDLRFLRYHPVPRKTAFNPQAAPTGQPPAGV